MKTRWSKGNKNLSFTAAIFGQRFYSVTTPRWSLPLQTHGYVHDSLLCHHYAYCAVSGSWVARLLLSKAPKVRGLRKWVKGFIDALDIDEDHVDSIWSTSHKGRRMEHYFRMRTFLPTFLLVVVGAALFHVLQVAAFDMLPQSLPHYKSWNPAKTESWALGELVTRSGYPKRSWRPWPAWINTFLQPFQTFSALGTSKNQIYSPFLIIRTVSVPKKSSRSCQSHSLKSIL